ncbi:MAG TPA: M23 family metallopeptidase [Smithellaceae bacterium]|jgi:hypothetical protein|nr:M23 family metallopeptidase [Smithellaceae bacterium]HQF83563.1 M23 family metallopeptidase [Smithellaceae bacterium]HQG79547.1 M23 family metallopeptidase [Smithellaceae bacterium]
MKKIIRQVLICATFFVLLCIVVSCSDSGSDLYYGLEGLDFPVKNFDDVDKYYCFALFPWDEEEKETHGGIDIAVWDDSPGVIKKVPLVAATPATVEWIVEGDTGAGVKSIVVILKMNEYWCMAYIFEPQTEDEEAFNEQRTSIYVNEGDRVARGQVIGDLIVKDPIATHYPHLHFGFFYKNPADTLQDLFDDPLSIHVSDGTDLAPLTGLGSPWQPFDLGKQTTFYCPYEYSTQTAKDFYDSRARMAVDGSVCSCICAYGSEDRDCGVCTP